MTVSIWINQVRNAGLRPFSRRRGPRSGHALTTEVQRTANVHSQWVLAAVVQSAATACPIMAWLCLCDV